MELLKLIILILRDSLVSLAPSKKSVDSGKKVALMINRNDIIGKKNTELVEKILLARRIQLITFGISRRNNPKLDLLQLLTIYDVLSVVMKVWFYRKEAENKDEVSVLNATALRILKKGKITKTFNNFFLKLRLEYSLLRNKICIERFSKFSNVIAVFITDPGYLGEYELAILFERNKNTTIFKLNNSFQESKFVINKNQPILSHPFDLQPGEYEEVVKKEWDVKEAQQALNELYYNKQWYNYVGTVDRITKKPPELETLISKSNEYKYVSAVFPHIVWDGTFFSGTNVFSDYQTWLEFILREILLINDKLWVIKLHPANDFKNEGRESAEKQIINRIFKNKSLPPNIIVIDSDSQISTLEILKLVNEVHSVRGTVLLEASIFGALPVAYGSSRFNTNKICLSVTSIEHAKSVLKQKNKPQSNKKYASQLLEYYLKDKSIDSNKLEKVIIKELENISKLS